MQINNFLEDTTISRLTQDSEVVANLAGAYGMDGNLNSRELMLNLDVVSQITNADIVVCDKDGNEIKEWYALAAYLESFGKDGVPEAYASGLGDGRKTVTHGLSPSELLTDWNWITWVVVLAALAVLLLAVLLVRLILRRARRKREKRN